MNLHPATEFVFVMSTVESIAQAEILASEILEAKLAACVTSIPGAVSTYWWEDKIEKSQEIVLLIKTQSKNLTALKSFFDSHHTYEISEFVALPISGGSIEYLNWMRAS